MAIWGVENFERDDALNVLDRWIDTILNEIREAFRFDCEESLYESYGESRIVGNIDIVSTLLEQYETNPNIELDEIVKWKNEYLENFDRTIQYYDPKPDFVPVRRKKVEATFDRFYEVVHKLLGD